jgi:hypothetical protein
MGRQRYDVVFIASERSTCFESFDFEFQSLVLSFFTLEDLHQHAGSTQFL